MRNDNVRVFFPVGMGGFSFERMDETTVVYDCGSSSDKVIKENIQSLKNEFFGVKKPVIDHLFISHFDSDHCNGVEQLLASFDVKEIHLPYIKYKYRAVLNMMTDNGVTNLFNMFIQSGTQSRFSFYQTNRFTAHAIRSKNGRWEWVITNLLNEKYFDKALDKLKGCGIGLEEHGCGEGHKEKAFGDPLEELIVIGGDKIEMPDGGQGKFYDDSRIQAERLSFYAVSDYNIGSKNNALLLIEKAMPTFNLMTVSDKLKDANRKVPDVVKDIEKNDGYAKNEYGMLMLSKSINDATTSALFFKNQELTRWVYYRNELEWTSCLYTGDMSMNKDDDLGTLLSLVRYNNAPLQFFQIPHHGSVHNSSLERLLYIDTRLYFCYDNNSRRLINNFGNVLSPHNPYIDPFFILLINRDSEMDEAIYIACPRTSRQTMR